MEGFLNIRIRPWLRRLITRLIAIGAGRAHRYLLRGKRHRPSSLF